MTATTHNHWSIKPPYLDGNERDKTTTTIIMKKRTFFRSEARGDLLVFGLCREITTIRSAHQQKLFTLPLLTSV